MSRISFQAKDDLQRKLQTIAESKGLNMSSFIRMALTDYTNRELSKVTENGFTVAEELDILDTIQKDEFVGPFDIVEEMIESLNSPD